SVRKTGASGGRRPMALIVVLGVIGVALLVGGLALDFKPGGFPVLSLVGFLVMFAGGVIAVRSPSSAGVVPGKERGAAPGAGGRAREPQPSTSPSCWSRLEDRFRRRFEQ